MIAKKISQTQMLFPKPQYPIHRAYIDLFVDFLTKHDTCVSESDIEILSIALGTSAHQQFKAVSSKTTVIDKLESLLTNGLTLKVEAKKRLLTDQAELSKESNKEVVDLVFAQYKVKPDQINPPKQQTSFKQQVEKIENRKSTTKASSKQLLAKNLQNTKQKTDIDVTAMLKKKSIQARALFPQNLYPHYRLFIDFLIQQATSEPLRISVTDMKSLSSAFGSEELDTFKNLNSHNTIEEKLKHIVFSGLQLKISAKKRLKDTGNELSKNANLLVIKEITERYQGKLDAIEAKKHQELEAKRQAIEAEKLREIQETEIEIERKKHFSDFPEFGIKNISKNSRTEKLLHKLLTKQITLDEKKWLDSEGVSSELVEIKYHIQLAHQHYQNWKQKNLPWELVNASASYRKARELKKIKKTLDEVYPFEEAKKDKKLKSALLTTYGGVCRDLQEYDRGVDLGHEAHKVTPLNFRPCTLLGAIYLSTGEFTLGHEWYGKAKERGFSQAAYDNDIKSIYFRASEEIKNRLKQNLIATGHKYKWL